MPPSCHEKTKKKRNAHDGAPKLEHVHHGTPDDDRDDDDVDESWWGKVYLRE